MTKSKRYREILTVLARHGIGVVDDELNATIFSAACIVGLAIVMLFFRPQGWQGWIGVVFWIGLPLQSSRGCEPC